LLKEIINAGCGLRKPAKYDEVTGMALKYYLSPKLFSTILGKLSRSKF